MAVLKQSDAELKWVRFEEGEALCEGRDVIETPFPPRQSGDLTELVSSLRLHGLVSPILLRSQGDGYQIVSGYNRFCAAREAGLSTIPAMVRELDDPEAIRCYLSAKAVRKPLSHESQQSALRALQGLRTGNAKRSAEVSVPVAPERREPLPELAKGSVTRASTIKRERPALAPRFGASVERSGSTSTRTRSMSGTDTCGGFSELADDTEAFLLEVRSQRSIRPGHASALVDRLLRLHARAPAIDSAQLYPSNSLRRTTAAHSVLVARLCASVASFLGWKSDAALTLVLGGFLHDVGMVFIDDADAPGQQGLNKAQRSGILHHTRIGHALVEAAGCWEAPVALCARDHHERYNGGGYPDGKLGRDICLHARVVAYLDTYAALMSPRPHRRAMDSDAAMTRLRNASEMGLFDPELLLPVLSALRNTPILGESSHTEQTVRTSENSVELSSAPVTMLPNGAT